MIRFQGDDDYLAHLLMADTPTRRPARWAWLAKLLPLVITIIDVCLAMQLARLLDVAGALVLSLGTSGVIYGLLRGKKYGRS